MSYATETANALRKLFSTVTRTGQRGIEVAVKGDTVTVPAWVLDSLLQDRAKLMAFQETHYDEMEDDEWD